MDIGEHGKLVYNAGGTIIMIDVVILNWNKRQALLAALESLFRQSERGFRVIVVDNASTDGSAAAVTDTYADRVQLVIHDHNLGGTGGFNSGLKLALLRENEAILLMDNDVVLAPDALEILIAALRQRQAAGAVGPKTFYKSNPRRIWCCGGIYRPLLAETTHRGGNSLGGDRYDDPAPVGYLPACALLVRRPVIDQVGLMDERFFIYNDDVDWCLRIRRAGWEIWLEPRAEAWHDISYQTTSLSPRIAYYSTRNQGLLLSKQGRRWQRWGAAMLLPLILLKRELIFASASRTAGWSHWLALNRAAWQGVRDWRAGRFGEQLNIDR